MYLTDPICLLHINHTSHFYVKGRVFSAILPIIASIVFMYRWGNIEFPLPFGRVLNPSESFIHELDEKVCSSKSGQLIFDSNLSP